MGFGQGLSGLNAAAQNLDVIGNNIANSGTVGFKSSTASFADVYASSRVGLGTKVSAITQRFTVCLLYTSRIPTLEAPPLARALYQHVELGHEIPGELYTCLLYTSRCV